MSEVYTEVPTQFTTADTIGPISISYSGDKLTVTFVNFQTPLQTVVFYDVRSFSWTGWNYAPPEASPDRIYRVDGSDFLAPWSGFSVGGLPYIHFKLGFVSEGKFLDVIATRMNQTEPNQALEPTTLSVTPCAPSSTGRAS